MESQYRVASESAQHKRATRSGTGQRQEKLVECLQRQDESAIYKDTTEARVCAFLAQYNLPFSQKSSLMSLFKSIAPKNVIAIAWRARGLELREVAKILQLFFGDQRQESVKRWLKSLGPQTEEFCCRFQFIDTVIC